MIIVIIMIIIVILVIVIILIKVIILIIVIILISKRVTDEGEVMPYFQTELDVSS